MKGQQSLSFDEETAQEAMLTHEETITEILNQYKRKKMDDPLILIPILDANDVTIGFLHPITADFKTTIEGCVELLNRWRVENPTLSPSRFPISHDRTERWITEAIILNDSRILFLVQDLSGRYIGHMGFTAICPKDNCAEIDLVVRGEKEINPGMMGYAMAALIRWGRQNLQLEDIYLAVLPYNEHGILFYQRCGFQKAGIIPLIKVDTDGEISWIRCEKASGLSEYYFLRMVLS